LSPSRELHEIRAAPGTIRECDFILPRVNWRQVGAMYFRCCRRGTALRLELRGWRLLCAWRVGEPINTCAPIRAQFVGGRDLFIDRYRARSTPFEGRTVSESISGIEHRPNILIGIALPAPSVTVFKTYWLSLRAARANGARVARSLQSPAVNSIRFVGWSAVRGH